MSQPDSAHPDDRLLRDFLESPGSLSDLAARHGIDRLIHWFNSDRTRAVLTSLAAIADARASLRAKLHQSAAITRLAEIVDDAREVPFRDRIRAASQLLRSARQTPAVSAQPLESAAAPPASSAPEPAPRPSATACPDPCPAEPGHSGLPRYGPPPRTGPPPAIPTGLQRGPAHRLIDLAGRTA